MSVKPRLVFSPLGRRVYVVTRYVERPGREPGTVILVASRKYDVTDDFRRLRAMRVRLRRSESAGGAALRGTPNT